MSAHSFKLTDALTAAVLIVLLLALSLTIIGCGGTSTSDKQKNSAQVRNLVKQMILFSQGNADKFPGLQLDGQEASSDVTRQKPFSSPKSGYHPQLRYAILLNETSIKPEHLIAPTDDTKRPAKPGEEVTADHYSYAMLVINEKDAIRNNDWNDTTNSQAAVVSDRNLAGAGTSARSIHSSDDPWQGSVGYGDGHVDFKSSNLVSDVKYTGGVQLNSDDLFVLGDGEIIGSQKPREGASAFDAAMCFAMPDDLTNQK